MTKLKLKDPTLGELISTYQDSADFRALAPPTQKTYNIYLRQFEKLHSRKVSSITRPEIYKIYDAMSERPGAQEAMIKVGRRMFTWGLEREVIESAPIIRRTRKDRQASLSKSWESWTDAEITAFRKSAKEYADTNPEYAYVADAFEAALSTGQRFGDIAESMKTEGWDGEYFKMIQAKTGAAIMFKPHGRFLEIILAAVARNDRYIIGISRPYHGRISRLRYHFNIVRDLAGVTKVFHGLRKTVAVKLIEKGASEAQVAALLGHKTRRMVEEYSRDARATKLASDAARIMSDVIFAE